MQHPVIDIPFILNTCLQENVRRDVVDHIWDLNAIAFTKKKNT